MPSASVCSRPKGPARFGPDAVLHVGDDLALEPDMSMRRDEQEHEDDDHLDEHDERDAPGRLPDRSGSSRAGRADRSTVSTRRSMTGVASMRSADRCAGLVERRRRHEPAGHAVVGRERRARPCRGRGDLHRGRRRRRRDGRGRRVDPQARPAASAASDGDRSRRALVVELAAGDEAQRVASSAAVGDAERRAGEQRGRRRGTAAGCGARPALIGSSRAARSARPAAAHPWRSPAPARDGDRVDGRRRRPAGPWAAGPSAGRRCRRGAGGVEHGRGDPGVGRREPRDLVRDSSTESSRGRRRGGRPARRRSSSRPWRCPAADLLASR